MAVSTTFCNSMNFNDIVLTFNAILLPYRVEWGQGYTPHFVFVQRVASQMVSDRTLEKLSSYPLSREHRASKYRFLLDFTSSPFKFTFPLNSAICNLGSR
jgi:hypothetical protein